MSLDIIKELNIDFYKTKYISINAKQYDKSSRFILVTCYNQGAIFPIDNVYNHVFVRYRKPDDLNVFNSCDVTEDGKILIELTEQMLAFVGKSFVDLVIVHNEPIPIDSIEVNNGELLTNENTSILSTMLFCVNVIETTLDNEEIESSEEYNALNNLLIKATEDYSYVKKACKISEDNAKTSEVNAKTSENNALTSEQNAKTSEQNALVSEQNAKASEINSEIYSKEANKSEENAKVSEENAKLSESNAKTSEENAKIFEMNADSFADVAAEKAEEALQHATVSYEHSMTSYDNALLSQSYAIGETGLRTNEDTENAKYYYNQTKIAINDMNGRFLPMGTIQFSELQSVEKDVGYVYHISDSFVTDDTFKCGAGVSYNIGTNVYYTADGYWDCFVGDLLTITDDGNGNVRIESTYDFVTTYEDFGTLSQTVIELQERIKELEEQTVLGIVE